MKQVDYIIVGDGYAGLFFAHQLIREGKSFVLFSGGTPGASHVSAGVINPVVLKKFTTFWLAQEQIDSLRKTMAEIEGYTGQQFLVDQPIRRVFHDDQERDLWLRKSQTEDLKPFLNRDFTSLPTVNNPWGVGTVNQSARLDVERFFVCFKNYLQEMGNLVSEQFEYSSLISDVNTYKNYHYRKIIFCEGMGVINNPYFSAIPVQANKGHHLKVRLSENLADNATLKKKHFLFPIANGEYYYGGTYDRHQLQDGIDPAAVQELEDGLKQLYPHPFSTATVQYGFRPTVKDRRPILGAHEKFNNLFVFNGLGARGILNGSYFAQTLYRFAEFMKPLPPEVDLKRFRAQ